MSRLSENVYRSHGHPTRRNALAASCVGVCDMESSSLKKGISALQLSREMEITHKSALFVLRRIRHGAGEAEPMKLTGTIEVDELYVGPRRPRHKGISKQGRGTLKTPVVGMVQRGGDVRFQMLERVTAENLTTSLQKTPT